MKIFIRYLLILLAFCLAVSVTACRGAGEDDGSEAQENESPEGSATFEPTESTSPKESDFTEPYVTMPNGDPNRDPWVDDAGDELWTTAAT